MKRIQWKMNKKDRGQKMKCVVCGYEDDEVNNRKYGNYVIYRNGEPICRACVEDYDLLLECGIKPNKLRER